jgi:hypothetical protein
MRNRTWLQVVAVCVLVAAVWSACGKKEEAAPARETGRAAADSGRAAGGPAGGSLTTANAPFAAAITARGYQVVKADHFPSQVDSRRAYMIIYRAADGSRGGALYARQFADEAPMAAWHWFYATGAPDSARAVDINRDGLWDLRIHSGAAAAEFVQDRDFTFMGPDRGALVAHNGASTAPAELWKAFDGDTASAWQSPAADAFIDVPNPFGLDRGELSVRLWGKGRPKKLVLFDGEKKVQELDLEQTTKEQRFVLDGALKDAATIRVRFEGAPSSVALSELEIR